MMEELQRAYLALLDELSADMDSLAELAREKCTAVRQDDLTALNDVMKREQVVGLSVRGKEQRRQKLALQLGLDGTRLGALPQYFPKSMISQVKESSERLRTSYSLFKEASEVARTTLEINLHEIEKIVAASGIDPAQSTNFRQPAVSEPPKNMKTDFRA